MQIHGRFFVRLMVAASCFALPLVAMMAYTLFEQQRTARDAAYAVVTAEAVERGNEVDALLQRGESLLAQLAMREDVLSLDPTRCLNTLRNITAGDPLFDDVVVLGATGRRICATSDASVVAEEAGSEDWFRGASAATDAWLSGPVHTAAQPHAQAMLTLALRGAGRDVVGVAVIAIDLFELGDRVLARGLAPGASMALLNEGTILARVPDPARWIGYQTSAIAREGRREAPTAVRVASGPDGVVRAYGNSPVGRHALRVTVGLPIDTIFARSRETQVRGLVLTVAAMALALLISVYGARWLSAPLRSLSATARAWAGGARDVLADETLPDEFRDVAVEFNRMIAARHAGEERLRNSEQRYAAMLDGVDVLAVTIDVDERLAYCNDALLRLTGWKRSEIIGQSWSARFLPPEQEQLKAFLRSKFGQGEAPRRHENEILTRDGSRRLVRWANASLLDENGVLTGTACIGEDISERRSAEMAQQASMAAEAANRAKTDFLARMSHELRTPLNAVLGFAQLLQLTARPRLSPEEQRQLDMIATGGTQLRALIEDVMDVSRIESGNLQVRAEDVDLSEVLNAVLRLTEADALALGIRVVPAYQQRPTVRLRTDPLRLRQIAVNLVSNSIKYNRGGGSVTIDVTVEPGEVAIAIDDDGIGMTKEQVAALFQPFNRLGRENSNVQGTGIGMVLSRELARLLGGELTVESQPGVGTQARVCLPGRIEGVTASLPKSATESSRPESGTQVAATPSGVVLYVEDNPINAALVQGLLSGWPDVRVVIAPDGASGVAEATVMRPDVVLLDGQLPDMDGLKVLALMRDRPELTDVPIVILSASAMPHEIDDAMKAGVQDYWTKPISAGPFLAGMQRLLAAADLRRAAT